MRRQDEALHRQVKGRRIPIVNRHGPDERGARDDGHVLRLAPVRMPGAHESRSMIPDGVKTLDAGEVEVVDEGYLAPIVDGEVTDIQHGFGHDLVLHASRPFAERTAA